MELCRYLFERFKEAGVRHVFGLPGDFVLPLFRALEEEPVIEPVILTHEPAVGYAADAYARVQGLGVAAVTYGAGAGGHGHNPDRCDHSSGCLLNSDAAPWRRRSPSGEQITPGSWKEARKIIDDLADTCELLFWGILAQASMRNLSP